MDSISRPLARNTSLGEFVIFARMAWRNIWRNKRRTLLTMGAVTFGLAILIISYGLADGCYDQMIRNATESYISNIQIHEKGYLDEPELAKRITGYREVEKKLEQDKEVSAYSPRVIGYGLAASEEFSAGVQILGIIPGKEKEVTSLAGKIIRGEYLKKSSGSKIVIGKKLAEYLDVDIGSSIVFMTQGMDGSIGNDLFEVAGIFQTGNSMLDDGVCLMGIEKARELLSIDDAVSEYAIKVKNLKKVGKTSARIKNNLNDPGLEILPWFRVSPEILTYIKVDRAGIYILMIIIYIIVALGILNTMLMAVFERVREFGILSAIGINPGQIRKLIMWETVFLTLVGILGGTIIGISVTMYYKYHGLDLSSKMESIEMVGTVIDTVIYFKLTLDAIVTSTISIFVIALLTAILPARKASGYLPADALRFN